MDYLNYKIKIDVNAITNVDQIWFKASKFVWLAVPTPLLQNATLIFPSIIVQLLVINFIIV